VAAFLDEFDGDRLDPAVWDPHYLPQWGTRAGTAASFDLGGSLLRLSIPADHPLWCPDLHEPPLRVSGIASGGHSGPVGSAVGGQPFLEGQTVREEQPRLEGWLPRRGEVAVRCRMAISPRSMAAVWLSGFEETPEESGELCVVEVFGKDVEPGRSAEIGMGVKQLRDPRLDHDFAAPRLPIDVAEWHEYAVHWDDGSATFTVDGSHVRTCHGPPTYPMQVMIAVFDFPGWSIGDDGHLVPSWSSTGSAARTSVPSGEPVETESRGHGLRRRHRHRISTRPSRLRMLSRGACSIWSDPRAESLVTRRCPPHHLRGCRSASR
jgi:glycosyl hydrolase family 16